MGLKGVPTPRRTGRLTVCRNITWTYADSSCVETTVLQLLHSATGQLLVARMLTDVILYMSILGSSYTNLVDSFSRPCVLSALRTETYKFLALSIEILV
jgi:hypothetical protein